VTKRAQKPQDVAARAAEIAMLEQQAKAASRLIAARRSRDSLLDFTRFTMPDPMDVDDASLSLYDTGWHHEAICELLEKVERGEILRAIITMPPRHGKSELASKRFPTWFMGRAPHRQTIFATYGSDFAEDFGRKAREIIDMPAFRQVFPKVALKKTSRAANRMETEQGGMMVFLGVDGPATGRGADLFMVDDPFKDRKEAESLTIRNSVWDWFKAVAYTRLMPGGRIVIILTRWHEDDIVGRIFNTDYVPKEEADKWFCLNLPGIIDEGQETERALWPSRFPLEVLKSTRAFIGERDWNSLYQQRPSPPEGVFFKNTDIYEYDQDEYQRVLKNHRPYMAGDLALGETTKHDESCVGVALVDQHDTIYISPDLYWNRKKADQSVETIIDMMLRHTPMTTWWEKGQIEKAVGPFLKKRMMEREAYFSVEGLPLSGDKGFRATAIRGRMSMAKVKFPKFAHWWPRAKDQLLKFTGSGDDAEDDFVDFVSCIGQGLSKQIRADKPGSNVIPLSRVGTLGWIKRQHAIEKREEKRLAARKGF
jgi:predicted phage terminase large subunit-like protein